MQVFYTYVDNFVDRKNIRENPTSMLRYRAVAACGVPNTPQAPDDATVLKRFFRDNFVIFRRRAKRIAFLESMNFLRVSVQIFNFCDGHVTTFRHLLEPISAKCLVTDSPD